MHVPLSATEWRQDSKSDSKPVQWTDVNTIGSMENGPLLGEKEECKVSKKKREGEGEREGEKRMGQKEKWEMERGTKGKKRETEKREGRNGGSRKYKGRSKGYRVLYITCT